MKAAPLNTPDHPNGMNGCQLAVATCQPWPLRKMMAMPRNTSSTETLMTTMALLTLADSEMPMIRMVVTIRMPRNASRLKAPVVWGMVGTNAMAAPLMELAGCQKPW